MRNALISNFGLRQFRLKAGPHAASFRPPRRGHGSASAMISIVIIVMTVITTCIIVLVVSMVSISLVLLVPKP